VTIWSLHQDKLLNKVVAIDTYLWFPAHLFPCTIKWSYTCSL